MNNLPESIINKVCLCNSHPIADLLNTFNKFKLIKCKAEHKHGCPFDGGGVDAYYRRICKPHYLIHEQNHNIRKTTRIETEDMTEAEIHEYHLGFVNEEDRKFMTEEEYHLSEMGLFEGYKIDFEGVYE